MTRRCERRNVLRPATPIRLVTESLPSTPAPYPISDDTLEISGLSALLHPDSEVTELDLTLRHAGRDYCATVHKSGGSWSFQLPAEQVDCPQGTGASEDEAVMSAMLAVLDTSIRRLAGDA